MPALDRTYRRFCLCITVAVVCAFGVIAIGSLVHTDSLSGPVHIPDALLSLGTMFLSAQLALFIAALFRGLERLNAQRAIAVGLHALMLILLLLFLHAFQGVRPTTDSFDDIETAWCLHRQGCIPRDFAHAKYVSKYGNNYLFILLLAGCFRLLEAVDTRDVLSCLCLINALAILTSAHLTWHFVRATRGIRAANRVLVLFALNPLFYGLACWVYTLTLALPISMGILCLGLLLYRCRRRTQQVPVSIFLGLLIALGYALRPPAVFVAIALAISGGAHILRAGQLRRYFPAVLALLVSATLALMGCQLAVRHSFQAFLPDNYPVTYWLSMGSHDNGNLASNGEDMAIADQCADAAERSAALLRRTVHNYRRLGPLGTLRLWTRKTYITWSNGYSSLHVRLSSGAHGSALYEYIAGNRRRPFVCFCDACRLICALGVCLSGIHALRHGSRRKDHFVCLLTLFGGVLFYLFWEAKTVYSTSFLPFMLILAQDGLAQTVPALRNAPLPAGPRRSLRACTCALSVAACLAIPLLCCRQAEYVDSRINSIANPRVTIPVEASRHIWQRFSVSRPFNRIALGCMNLRTDGRPAPCKVAITNTANGQRLAFTITEADLRGKAALLVFDTLPAGGDYLLHIDRQNPAAALTFYTKDTALLDLYPGTLETDVRTDFASDLMMNVEYAAREPWCSRGASACLTLAYAAFAAAGCLPRRRT